VEASVHEFPAKRTRAQVLRDRVKIRLALDETGKAIAAILKANGVQIPGADWGKVFPNWLIATVEDEVIGCIQVMPGKPVGWLSFMCVKPGAPFKLRAIAMRKLIEQGAGTMRIAGAKSVATITLDGKLKKVLGNGGFVDLGEVSLMARLV
jgi:hypothetical protein